MSMTGLWRRSRSVLVCAAAALTAAVGCRDHHGTSPSAAARGPVAGRPRVGIVFDLAGKDDRSFNAAAWEGGQRAARQLGVEVRDAEPGDPASVEPSLRAFAERGYELIVGVGFAQAPIITGVARDYPGLDFAVVDGVAAGANVASLTFREQEGSYLVGMIAARVSRTGVLGFVGGMDIPLIRKFVVGYREGAGAARPGVRVVASYVGVGDAAWNDPVRGKELAAAQISQGADVLFAAAGNSGLGVFDAAEQSGVYVIGVDSNQNWIKPGHVLTSMVKRVDNAVFDLIAERQRGRIRGGVHSFGLSDGGVGYALDLYNRSLIPAAVLRDVEQARRRILSGELHVTDAMAAAPASGAQPPGAPAAAGLKPVVGAPPDTAAGTSTARPARRAPGAGS